MINKKLSVLSASIVFTAGANGAISINTGGDTLVVLNTAGKGSYYQFVPGLSGDTLVAGGGMSIDISAAAAALGGSIDNFAIIALASPSADGSIPSNPIMYNYSEFLYVDSGGGLVFVGDAGFAPTSNLAAISEISQIKTFLANANLGLNAEGSIGDFDVFSITANLLVTGPAPIILNAQRDGNTNQTVPLALQSVSLNGTTLVATGNFTPQTTITYPPANLQLQAGENLTVEVSASDSDGFIDNCQLYINGTYFGQDTNSPYQFSGGTLDNLVKGNYSLQATCIDNEGFASLATQDFYVTNTLISGDLTGTTNHGDSTSGTIIASDPDGLTDGTYFTISSSPSIGQALINPTSGFWIYLADVLYVGPDPFTVMVTDDLGEQTTQVIDINVIGVDTDGDTWYDILDNCPSTANVGQEDLDNDGLGDVCDEDIDGDGTNNTFDAFPYDPTEDTDTDGDLVGDNSDNCVNDINTNQEDLDGDGLGDICDADIDGDGILNIVEVQFGGNEFDNSDTAIVQSNIELFAANAGADTDLDGIPDAIENAVGTDPNDPSDAQSALDTIITGIAKSVPALGLPAALVMFLTMLGIGVSKSYRPKK